MTIRLAPARRAFARVSLLSLLVAAAACSAGSDEHTLPPNGPPPPGVTVTPDPGTYSISYRNHVRVPEDGQALSALGFANQINTLDPISDVRCPADGSSAFADATTFLGGIAWSHPVSILLDQSLPPLLTAPRQYMAPEAVGGASAGAASPAGPTISRPDLVGYSNGIAVFLSTLHGLIAVDTQSGQMLPSCAMKLPGDPRNFLFYGDELVVVVNALAGMNRAALLRYSFAGGTFRFVDAVKLEGQTILDARLFDATIVAYTSWSKTRQAPPPPPDSALPPATVPDTYGAFYGGVAGEGAAASPAGGYPGYQPDGLGTKVIVVQWGSAPLKVDWEDALLNDPPKQDPLEGTDPTKTYQVGDLVSEVKSYQSFVAASDRYIAVPRDVQRTTFAGYQTYSYTVCTNYNPHYEQVQQCSVQYKQEPNPDYQAPDPTTGDYSCNGQSLADCIQAAAPVVTQYIEVPVGKTCDNVWIGQCEAYDTLTGSYPTFNQDSATEMTIYRFEGGTFTKLDASLATLVTDPANPGVISFTKDPLSVKGAISNQNQIQFQNGQLYVFADSALQTLGVANNSISYTGRLDISADTTADPAIAFSTDRAMISASDYYQQSNVTMIDLSVPVLPTLLQSFAMPGNTSQLLLTGGGILGPGQVQTSYGNTTRNLEKLTLFSRDTGSELDNLLLGTEYDALDSSYFDPTDDQRIRLTPSGDRLLLPYSGQHQAAPTDPVTHRLNVTRIDSGRLVSERSFDVDDDVIRTSPIDDTHALVFGNSGIYFIDHSSGDWVLSTIREIYTPFASYRISDADIYAVVSRIGSKCRVSTHAGVPTDFQTDAIASVDVACGEGELPIAFQTQLVFPQTQTGVSISPDGTQMTALSSDAAQATLKGTNIDRGYCYVAGGTGTASLVEYLDDVPSQVRCQANPTAP